MSYTMTLTSECRQAIDWIGGRYGHGYDLKMILWNKTEYSDEIEWESEENIIFNIPECVAWEIKDLLEEDWLACINTNSDLADEFRRFLNSIV